MWMSSQSVLCCRKFHNMLFLRHKLLWANLAPNLVVCWMVSHQAMGEPLMREVIREYCQPVLRAGQLQGEALLAAFKPRGYSECIVISGGEDRKWVHVFIFIICILFGHKIIYHQHYYYHNLCCPVDSFSVQSWPTKKLFYFTKDFEKKH